ncbi:LacI family DNA-binding transcriptional regulator [Microbacterium hominis]|uniref:LacI family DNA-binding transcriptional regulator n=1 Tax=Microbacterium hominis TaxID=162426 RepID=A0A7D4U643_9MICO|nr:LacI family DNA-binding transcriptional regulator [Microbacterium hominis]QKJ18046.1 LacI family DNA-binding transcriptional regulator [Microbacterium hominis]
MAATLHDVAQLAGVSIKTVSNVVNDYPHVRTATRERVQAAIAQLGYQPNLSARTLRSGRSGVIGLVLPELSLSYFAELADAVIAQAELHGLVVIIERTGADRARELAVLSSPRMRMTDGVIFSPLGMGQADAHFLEVDFPLVLLGERIFGGPVDHVTMRNIEAARAATEFLLGSGRQRVALIGAHPDEDLGSAALRLEGYKEALASAGVAYDPELVRSTTLWHRANGAAATRELIDSGVDFDAVFGLNDALTLGVMRVLQESGRRIPEDVAVIGFDNIEEAEYAVPSLTTIDPGRELIAQRAVDLLVQQIGSGAQRPEHPTAETVGFEVIVRESAPA